MKAARQLAPIFLTVAAISISSVEQAPLLVFQLDRASPSSRQAGLTATLRQLIGLEQRRIEVITSIDV